MSPHCLFPLLLALIGRPLFFFLHTRFLIPLFTPLLRVLILLRMMVRMLFTRRDSFFLRLCQFTLPLLRLTITITMHTHNPIHFFIVFISLRLLLSLSCPRLAGSSPIMQVGSCHRSRTPLCPRRLDQMLRSPSESQRVVRSLLRYSLLLALGVGGCGGWYGFLRQLRLLPL